MHVLSRTVTLLLVSSLALVSCTDDEPSMDTSIEAFTGTPQVIRRGESVDLRWRVRDTLLIDLRAYRGSAMPDATQAWSCRLEGRDMVCRAPRIPPSDNGWTCEGDTCRRSVDDDLGQYAHVDLGPEHIPTGNYTVWPDETFTYRLEAQGSGNARSVAWVQVVLNDQPSARIVSFSAWPTPALIGEDVTISYRTEGCDTVDDISVDGDPTLTSAMIREGELIEAEGNDHTAGTYTWTEATETHDFYLGCHPAEETDNEDARIRSHITIPVIQQPEICERIDLFSVLPAAEVAPGTEIEVSWQVSNARSVSGEAVPAPSDPFYIGSTRFSGTWRGTIEETTVFTITAVGECHDVTASHEVTVVDD